MATNEVVENDRGWDEFVETMDELAEQPYVTVGVHAKDNEASNDEDSDIKMAALLGVHEFGMTIEGTAFGTITIPERSVLRSTERENRDDYFRFLFRRMGSVLTGDASMKGLLRKLGAKAQGDVRQKFGSDDLVDNAEVTQILKGPSDQKVNNPLIDSGQLRQSIDYEVVWP